MAGSFPVSLNGQQFSNLTLGGKNYVYNYPDLLSAAVEQGKLLNAYTGRAELKRRWFPRLGTFTFNATPNRIWQTGMLFFAYGTDYTGTPASGSVTGIINSYDRETGVLVVDVQGYSAAMEVGYIVFNTATITKYPNLTAPLAIASGGTGASAIASVINTLDLPIPSLQLDEIFDDFTVGAINQNGDLYASPYRVLDKVGTALYGQWPGLEPADPTNALNWENRAGFLELSVSATSDAVTLARGVGGCHMGGGNLDFSCAIYIPTLSDVTNTFKVWAGLMGYNSSATDLFSYAGVGFTYTNGENSGQWTVRYGTGGTVGSFASGIAVVAGAWYTLRLLWNGTNCTPSINGVNLTTIAAANLPQSGNLNTITPAARIVKTAGASLRTANIDYFYRQKKVSR